MFCTNCGKAVADGDAFCSACGKKTVLSDREQTLPQDSPNTASEQHEQEYAADAAPRVEREAHVPGFGQQAGWDGAVRAQPASKVTLGGKRAIAAMASAVVAAILAGGTIGYAINMSNPEALQDVKGQSDAVQAVDQGDVQEQKSIGVRNAVDEYSWDELATISDAIAVATSQDEALRIARDFNLVGPSGKLDGSQCKTVRLANGSVVQAQIIGFSHDVRADGGKAGITFMFKDCIAEHQLNANNSNSGGWRGSDLRAWMNNALVNDLPNDLRNSLVAVSKVTNNVGKTSTRASVTSTYDKLWVPSYSELVGYVDLSSYERAYEPVGRARVGEFQTYFDIWNAEGAQYKLFADQGVRMATPSGALMKQTVLGSPCSWWGRSSAPGQWDRVESVSVDGQVQKSSVSPDRMLGVAPCFSLGRHAAQHLAEPTSVNVDNSVTNYNSYDVHYAWVVEDNSKRLDVVYVDRSTNTINNEYNMTNNEYNTIHNEYHSTDVDNSTNIDNSTNVDEGTADDEYTDTGDTYDDAREDDSYFDADDGYDAGEDPADGDADSADYGEGYPEADDDFGFGGHDESDDRDEAEGEDDSSESADHEHESDASAPAGSHDEGESKPETAHVDDSDDYIYVTGIVKVRHDGDHDACHLVVPRPVEIKDPEKGTVSSTRIELDTSLSVYEGRQVTLRMRLEANADGTDGEDGPARIKAVGDADVAWVFDGREGEVMLDDAELGSSGAESPDGANAQESGAAEAGSGEAADGESAND